MLANVSRGLQFTTMHVARNAERASGVALFLGQYPFAIALALSMTRLIAGEEPTGRGYFSDRSRVGLDSYDDDNLLRRYRGRCIRPSIYREG